MGHYNVHCTLSGVPISPGDSVVGWELQKSVFHDSNLKWLPKCAPMRGTYDSYGGIEVENGPSTVSFRGDYMAICHIDLWDTVSEMWDQKDGKKSLLEFLKIAHKEYLQMHKNNADMVESCKKPGFEDKDKFWERKLADTYQTADLGLSNAERHTHEYGRLRSITKLYLGEVKHIHNDPRPTSERVGPFEKMILEMVLSENLNEAFVKDLETLGVVYSTVCIRGRPVFPTQDTFAIQDSDYKKEFKWFQKVSAMCRKQRSEQVKIEEENRKEEEECQSI